MKYEGAWVPRDNPNELRVIQFEPNPEWEKYERDQKAIEAVHKGADAENAFFSYVHAIEWHGLRVRCLTHKVWEDR